jgi:hypothetical protein
MSWRANVWLGLGVLFAFVNLGGGVYAAAQGELLHAGVHAGLLLLGVYLMWRLVPRRSARPLPNELTDRLTNLEQAVDAVAVEVERIGEGQRFMTRFFTENRTPRAHGEGASESVETKR